MTERQMDVMKLWVGMEFVTEDRAGAAQVCSGRQAGRGGSREGHRMYCGTGEKLEGVMEQ